jgi:hypothetical protein
VVLLTPESINSTWVKLEVGAAWGLGKSKRILVIRCHTNIDPIPDMLKNKKSIPLNDFEDYLKELTLRVRG